MDVSFGSRLKHAWNTFMNRDPTVYYRDVGPGSRYHPDRTRLSVRNERSVITSVYNRIALDASAIPIQHIKLDENDRFLSVVNGQDFFIGDIVQIKNEYGMEAKSRVSELVLSQEETGEAVYPTFTSISNE